MSEERGMPEEVWIKFWIDEAGRKQHRIISETPFPEDEVKYIRADRASRVPGASEKVDFDLDAEIRKAWRNHCHGTGDFDVMDNQIFRMTKNEFRAGVMEIFLAVRASERLHTEGK